MLHYHPVERLIHIVKLNAPCPVDDTNVISTQRAVQYEDLVLKSYEPILTVLKRYGVNPIIFLTFANTRLLIPSILKGGFNCLWACEISMKDMDYRDLRREFGRDLRLIGGIDLDALRLDKEAIKREVYEKVPPLLANGGFVPLADGRVRADVPLENYIYYRRLFEEVTT